ncbi:phosphoesterase [Halobium salinum]|uniref:Phosphoesterase n=1 Tax=Halobium salinum TaxID=1364940 RepID=A0ABD5P9R0_9EURY|nr:phosphoesterase [Halobium salinum]
MTLLETVMQYYAYLFHPAVVLGLGALLTVHWEWARTDLGRSALYRRWGTFLAAGAASLVPSLAYMLVTGQGPVETMQGNGPQVDTLVAGGIFLAAGATWALWRRFDWGDVVPALVVAYAAVAVPYVVLSPFWNISGHVLLSTTPAAFLVLLDRQYWPTLAVPVVMVPNRPVVGAHTWPQAVGGFLVAATVVVAVYALYDGGVAGRSGSSTGADSPESSAPRRTG